MRRRGDSFFEVKNCDSLKGIKAKAAPISSNNCFWFTGRTKLLRIYRQTIISLIVCLRFFQSSSPPPVSPFFAVVDTIKVYSPPKNSNANVAICLIVKNETRYLEALGFSPIFIYDDALAPDIELETWYDRREDIHNYLTIFHFPKSPVQKAAYDQCLRNEAKNSTFAGLFDVDEFLILKTHANVVDFMEDHCDAECGQIGINWHVMSSSLEKRYRPAPITKRNIHASNLDYLDKIVKVIVRPSYVVDDDMDWTHTVRLKRGFWIDTNRTVVDRPDNKEDHWSGKQIHQGPTVTAQFYHYRWKSVEEYHDKTCLRGNSLHIRGDFPHCGGRLEKIGMYKVEKNGGIFDDTAWKHLKRLVPKYAMYDQK